MQLITGNEFKCPLCTQGMDVDEWDTEYNDPSPGEHTVTCVNCHKKFTLRVYVNVEFSAYVPVEDDGLPPF